MISRYICQQPSLASEIMLKIICGPSQNTNGPFVFTPKTNHSMAWLEVNRQTAPFLDKLNPLDLYHIWAWFPCSHMPKQNHLRGVWKNRSKQVTCESSVTFRYFWSAHLISHMAQIWYKSSMYICRKKNDLFLFFALLLSLLTYAHSLILELFELLRWGTNKRLRPGLMLAEATANFRA